MSIKIQRDMTKNQRLVHLAVGIVCGLITIVVASFPSFGGDYIVIGTGALFSLGGLIGGIRGKEAI